MGGARGGGKTDGILGKFGICARKYGADFNAIFFRKEIPQADDLIDRAKQIYVPLGAHYNDQKKLFTFPNGARVRFRPLESDADAEKYQGQNITHAAVEEAGNYPDPKPIWKLFGALRSTAGVPTQLILSFNPGGPGHWWLKQTFIKPNPLGYTRLEKRLSNGKAFYYTYIRSLVQNNPILLSKDPEYINRLHMVGSPELVRAWLEGDFEIHEGTYFPEFGIRHIVSPFTIPTHWTSRYFGFDWGYASPFCGVWGVVSSGKWDNGTECPYPKGAIIIYRECWGKRIENAEIASKLVTLNGNEDCVTVADPSIFKHDGGPSINDQFKYIFAKTYFRSFRPADNDRISGWNEIRRRLAPNPAMLYISTACPYLLDTLPALGMDPKHPEDADTTGEDHAPDALRYLCKERMLESEYSIKTDAVRYGKVRIKQLVDESRKIGNRPTV